MKITSRSYPYPVLRSGNDDFIDSSFQCKLHPGKLSSEKFHFNITFTLDNEDLQQLIDHKQAFFGIHVECQRTRLRKTFKTSDKSYEFALEKKDCREKIEIRTFIIADTVIDNYSSAKFNEEYEDVSFRVEKGSRLAIGNSYDIKVDEEDEYELSNPLFIIQKNNQPNASALEVNHEDDLVIVYLSPDNFNNCKDMVNIYRDFIASSIGIPVITYLIERLREDDEVDKRWAKILQKKMEELGLEDKDSLVAANAILEDTLTKGINFMKYVMEQNDGEED